MTVAFVRSHNVAFNKTSGTTVACEITATTTAGNLLVAFVLFDNAGVASKPVVSSIGTRGSESASWQSLGAARSTSTSSGAFSSGEVWAIKTNVSWPVGTFTLTLDTSVTMKSVVIVEFSGAERILRSTTGSAYSTTTTAASAATTGTAPVVGDLALGFLFGSNVGAAQAGDNDTTGGSWSSVTGVGSTGGSGTTNNFGVAQYKIVTSTSHQTYNNSAAMTAGNGSIVAVLQATPDPLVTQAAYRFYADGTETGATALAAQDTAYTADLSSGDVNLQLRVRLQETNSGVVPSTDDWQLQWEKNASGTWANVGGGSVGEALVDGYSEANVDANEPIDAANDGSGQSFLGNGEYLTRVGFYLRKVGSPTGTLTVRLRTHSGTFGSTGVGAGLLETSTTTVAASTLTTSYVWYDFDFAAGVRLLTAGTPYVVVVQIDTADGTNYVQVGSDSTGTHAGNAISFATVGGWTAFAAADRAFRVFSTATTVVPYASANLTTLVDGYDETNQSATASLANVDLANGQTFIGNGLPLTRAGFYLDKSGSPTSTVTAELYAHTGTFGSTGTATGSALAISTPKSASSFQSDTGRWEDFNFDGSFTLTNGTPYVIAFNLSAVGNVSNCVEAGVDITSPAHTGNSASKNSSGVWSSSSSDDLIFRAYTAGGPTTNRLGAGSGSFVAGRSSIDGLVDDLGWSASNYTELLYSVTLKQADLADGDTLRFRVLRNSATTGMTYTQVPTANVTIGAGQVGQEWVYRNSGHTSTLVDWGNNSAELWSAMAVELNSATAVDAAVSASTVAAVAAVASPAKAAGHGVVATTVAVVAAVGTAVPHANAAPDPGDALPLHAAVGVPVPHSGVDLSPATVAAVTAVATPTTIGGTGTSVSATTVAAVASVGVAVPHSGVGFEHTTITRSVVVGTPTVAAGAQAAVTATVISRAVVVGAAAAGVGYAVTATTVSGITSVGAPSLVAGTQAAVTPTGISRSVVAGSPTVDAGHTVTVTGISRSVVVGAPIVDAGHAATVTGISCPVVVGSPTVAAGTQAAVTGITVTATSTVSGTAAAGGSASVPATTVVVVASVAGAAPHAPVTIAPATVAGLAVVGVPVPHAAVTVAPSGITRSVVVGVPTVSATAGGTVTAATVAVVTTVAGATPHAPVSIAPATVARSVTIGAPSVATTAPAAPSTIARVVVVGTPTVATGSGVAVTVTAIALQAAVAGAVKVAGAAVTATTVTATATVFTPNVTAQQPSNVDAVTVTATATVDDPETSAEVAVTVNTITVTSTVAGPGIGVGVNVSPATIAVIVTVAGGEAAAPGSDRDIWVTGILIRGLSGTLLPPATTGSLLPMEV